MDIIRITVYAFYSKTLKQTLIFSRGRVISKLTSFGYFDNRPTLAYACLYGTLMTGC